MAEEGAASYKGVASADEGGEAVAEEEHGRRISAPQVDHHFIDAIIVLREASEDSSTRPSPLRLLYGDYTSSWLQVFTH